MKSAIQKTTATEAAVTVSRNTLPSGRQIVASADSHGERIEIRSAEGDLEIAITLTAEGPVLKLRGAKLELDSTDTVTVRCRKFELTASEGLTMRTGGDFGIESDSEIRFKSAEQTFIDGDYVNLNCLDRKGYHDYEEKADT